MKRWICLLIACMLMLCGCNAQTTEDPSTEPNDPVVVPIGERTAEGVKVTIHSGLLGMDSEVLSDAQKADGFLDAVRNEDDSVTYTIANDKYEAFVEKKRQTMCNSITQTVNDSFQSVTSVTYEPDLSAITLTVRRADYEFSVDAIAVFAVGSMAITYQAYDIDSAGNCVITVLDENGEQVSKTVYPEELIL